MSARCARQSGRIDRHAYLNRELRMHASNPASGPAPAAPAVAANAAAAQSNPKAQARNSQPQPVLRSIEDSGGAYWLPQEIIERILLELRPDQMLVASTTCKPWLAASMPMREGLALAPKLRSLLAAGNNKLEARIFLEHLQQAITCPPRYAVQAFGVLASYIGRVDAEESWQCFESMLAVLPRLPADYRRLALCHLARKLYFYAPRTGGREEAGTPDSAFSKALGAVIAAAAELDITGKALVFSALCSNLLASGRQLNGLLPALRSFAQSWSGAEIERDRLGWAKALKTSLRDADAGTAEMDLEQFGFYRMPLVHDMIVKAAGTLEFPQFCKELSSAGLLPAEIDELLVMNTVARLISCFTFFKPCLIEKGGGLIDYLDQSELSSRRMADLLGVPAASGLPILRHLMMLLAGAKRDETEHFDEMVESAKIYLRRIFSSRKLTARAKVDLLRSRATDERARKSAPEKARRFTLGPEGATPFFGLSLIDSLLCDQSEVLLRAYLLEILRSSLPDEVKLQVLRLDYPDRTGLPDMNSAHVTYYSLIGTSRLPAAMQAELIKGTLSDFEASCTLV
jgi:hypothetical protein